MQIFWIAFIFLFTKISHSFAFRHNHNAHGAILNQEWLSFKTKYQKVYSNPFEEAQRRSIFFNTYREILSFNSRPHSYKEGVNEYTDSTDSEWASRMGFNPSNTSSPRISTLKFTEAELRQEIPDSFDWRKENCITRVKSQKDCGSCWAFAALGALEGVHCKENGELVELSEQNVLDCSGAGSCRGSRQLYLAYEGLMNNSKGVVREDCYAYKSKQEECEYPKLKSCHSVTVKNYTKVNDDEEAMKIQIATKGPTVIGVSVNRSFQRYESGIFKGCHFWNELNHAVVLVGYGTEGEDEYWIVKNSWGDKWGDGGYIKIQRGVNMCKIAYESVLPIV